MRVFIEIFSTDGRKTDGRDPDFGLPVRRLGRPTDGMADALDALPGQISGRTVVEEDENDQGDDSTTLLGAEGPM